MFLNSLYLGGIYESDDFYDVADELGIMIWQDFMFACSMYPANEETLKSIKEETKHQVNDTKLTSRPFPYCVKTIENCILILIGYQYFCRFKGCNIMQALQFGLETMRTKRRWCKTGSEQMIIMSSTKWIILNCMLIRSCLWYTSLTQLEPSW